MYVLSLGGSMGRRRSREASKLEYIIFGSLSVGIEAARAPHIILLLF